MPEARDKAGPKNGAVSMVTVNIDPLGAVSVTADVTVQGQGHETVLSQIVADRLGLTPDAGPDDVEAALVRVRGTRVEAYLVPIDACYELVGLVRMHWKGFDGGQEGWDAIDGFFDAVKERSREVEEGAEP
jgi:hypothetical protein